MLKTPATIWCLRSNICAMDLSALRTVPFLHGNGLSLLWASPHCYRNGFANTDSVLAYTADVGTGYSLHGDIQSEVSK